MNHETLHGGECSTDPSMIKHRESQHWNAMLAPMVGFSLKMALWYQGEADAVRTYFINSMAAHSRSSWKLASDLDTACYCAAFAGATDDQYQQGVRPGDRQLPLPCAV